MSDDFRLALYRHDLGPGDGLALPPGIRTLYVLSGDVAVTVGGGSSSLTASGAWHDPGPCAVTGGQAGAVLLRYELRRAAPAAGSHPAAGGRVLLDHPIALDPSRPYLMRCDRVEFGPGGEALPHGHRGGGIRCLIAGSLEVRVGDRPGRVMRPGDAWFESGVEPVHALASRHEPTAFVRVSILPREIRGQSSIVYVDPAHASVKPRTYTVYVDAPIEIT